MKKITLMFALMGLSMQAADFTGKPPKINAKITNEGRYPVQVTVHGLRTILNMRGTDVPPVSFIIQPGASHILDGSEISRHYAHHDAAWAADRVSIEGMPISGPNVGKVTRMGLSINKVGHQDRIGLTGS